ncbi:LOW QUALITY PROTEIN: hypothetical protein Smp_183760 [Schistosoma mansoni]|nr:LOW QUALITY PROTEIN: hypothetical protein Smp_183760 [Schistosoma mansoni]|eukprot:XP_018654613.1 LOW QUALITY PROTEIN: hypothetical protein Smp_183760 [Schistosoma mansoni]
MAFSIFRRYFMICMYQSKIVLYSSTRISVNSSTLVTTAVTLSNKI